MSNSNRQDTTGVPQPLAPYVPICDAIVELFRPHVEVVLHDLATQTILYIANSYSKRRAGDSSLNEPEPAFDLDDDVIGPYQKTNWDGRRLKSVTAVIRDLEDKPIGLLCINHDIEPFASVLEQLEGLIELPKPSKQPAALFAEDWREGVNAIVGGFLTTRNVTLSGLASEGVDELIAELDQRGVFEIRKAIPYVAEVLQLSRATIYNRLASVRQRA
jgi:predicted transcriptional regulator YheO